jgi:Holliday junction resolvase RusA-like endonuclease
MLAQKSAKPAAAETANGLQNIDRLGGSISEENSPTLASVQAAPVTVVIRGPTVAKGRPRFTRRGFAYTPAKTRKYEAHGRLAAQLAMGDRPAVNAPVYLTALIEIPIPSSWSKRRTAAAIVGEIRPTSRPDIDNQLKAGMDAINGIVVADDSLIVSVKAEKKFGLDPKLVLLIEPITASPSNREARR